MTLILVAVGWLAGIAVVALWSTPSWVGAALTAGLAPVVLLMGTPTRARTAVVMAIVLAALAGGAIFAHWDGRPAPDAVRYLGHTVTFEGVVVSEPAPSETSTAYVVSMQRVRTKQGWVTTSGRVRVSVGQYERHLPGDHVEVTGKLDAAPVFPDFNYREYLARRGIAGTMYRPQVTVTGSASNANMAAVAARARLRLDDSLQRALPEPVAALAGGIAFGRDGGIPAGLYDDFRTTGLAHIVAVSGSNVSILAALAFLLLVPAFGRRWAIVPAGLFVAMYVVAAGASASVVRAGIMAAVLLVGEWLGRPQSSLPGLALAVMLMTAVQPSAAIDVGFQLSVAATAGLIAFGPWLRWACQRWLQRGPGRAIPGLVVESMALTLAATIATLPLLWVNFGRVSLISPLANVIVTPFLLVALPLAMLTAVAGAISVPIGWGLGLVAYYPLAFIIGVARTLGAIPGASIPAPHTNGTVAALAMTVLCTVGWFGYRYIAPPIAPQRPLPRPLLVARGATASAFGAVAIVAFVRASLLPIGGPGQFEMRALDVGQGDAILLTTPHGHTMLIDGGASDMVLARRLGEVLPHWDRSIDMVFVTHPDADHIGGVAGVLRRFDVANTWDTGISSASSDAAAYASRATRMFVREGDHFELDGVRVDILWPPAGMNARATNASSLVMRVTYGSTRFLFTGDLEDTEQRALMASEDVRASVLKVPHHGSKTSDPAFFRAVGAEVAVISVGANNRYGHPAAETLNALADEHVLRTDQHGRVTVRSDGEHIWTATER